MSTNSGSKEPVAHVDSPTSRIDKICDEFEKAWQAGTPPRIEDVLADIDIGQRSRVFNELLEIELDFLQRSGAEPKADEYRSKYPELAEQVAAIFARSAAGQLAGRTPRRLGDYELLEEIGHGGMGVVYRARQVFLRQIVALKVLPQHCLSDTQAVARFRREMQLIGSLDHPNIVRAFNAGEAAGVHYLVMEFVDGVNLQSFIGSKTFSGGPQSVAVASEIVRQAALGLQHAHEHHLVHRDIKPGNLMVNRSGLTKVLDLGLAKFLAEQEDGSLAGPAEKLTQVGIAMGTVDYMAPEQWENPSQVDIRSDIYSLGCTFFYLLTGTPPYGGPNYDTSRKKLMAHVVAPPPSLILACGERGLDFPPELEEVFSKMMAKDADKRFNTPGEVAEALADFADAEELAGLMASFDPKEHAGGAPQRHTGIATETQRKVGSRQRAVGNRRRAIGSRRTFYWLLIVPVATCVLAATWFGMRNWGGAIKPALPDGHLTTQTTPVNQDELNRQALATDLALLPGLNGGRWFDETPWYLPFVRQAVAEKISGSGDLSSLLGPDERVYLQPNVAVVRNWLWDVVGRCRSSLSPREIKLMDDMRALSESGEGRPQRTAALAEALDRFAPPATEITPPADRHALALLQNELAVLKNDRSLAAEAKKNYDAALAGYDHTSPAPAKLRWLCMADEALFTSRVLADYKEAKRLYESVLANPAAISRPQQALFRIDTLVAYGTESTFWARTSNDYQDILFEYAKKVLDASNLDAKSAVPRGHPLAAHIAERYAWSLMDQWKVSEAALQFQEAYIIRSENKRELNPFATTYVFYVRHGTGLTARYRGNIDGARRSFRTIVEDVHTAVNEIERQADFPGKQRLLRDLAERAAAAQERWADCELYGGAAAGLPVNLAQACELYESARAAATEAGNGHILTGKLAIVRCLHGQTERARQLIDELDREASNVLGSDNERAGLMHQAADAVLKLKEKGAAEGQKALRAFLDQFKLNPSYRDSTRRETLELQLFCADLLLTSDLESAASPASSHRPQRDLKYLDPLLAVFNGRRDMRPFLRPFYELATRACDKNDLVQMAHYVLESRMAPLKSGLRPKDVTLVIFQFAPQDNFAIFLPQDGRHGKRFDLELKREQIQEAASLGKPLHLNDELVRMMNEELAAGRSLEVSWSDSTSRTSEDHAALTDNQWPFDGQIKLPK